MKIQSETESNTRSYSKIINGATGIKKIQKVFDKFRIPQGEEIVAHIKSSIPFMAPIFVITDKAIYPDVGDPIPIKSICKYIITQQDSKASVSISTATTRRDILSFTIIAKNTAGTELVWFIEDLQKKLVRDFSWAKQQRDELFKELLEIARSEMQTGQISDDKICLLNAISEEPAYKSSVAYLFGENMFRTCSQADFENFCRQNSKCTHSTRTILLNSQERFSENLIRDLGDISLDFNINYLESAYNNMSALTSYSENQCLILAYLCARLGKENQFKTIREQVHRRCSEDKARSLDFFKGRYFNHRMKKVYEMVKQGTIPPAECLNWTDSIGLSALHYAILLNRESLVEDLLEKKNWTVKVPVSDGEAELLYDYTVLACYKNLSIRRTVFQKTSDIVAAQLRSRKALESRLWLKKRKLDIQNAAAQKARELMRTARKNGLYDKEEEFREKLDNVSVLREETQMEIDEINQSISDIDYEISVLTSDAMVDAADTIQRLQGSKNPFVQYLFRLFSDLDVLLHMLSVQEGTFRLYSYNGFQFVTPDSIHIDLPYIVDQMQKEEHSSGHQESDQKQYQEYRHQNTNKQNRSHSQKRQSQKEQKKSTEDPITKPYGTSWFSPEAHRNMKKLREEYRSLAKKYHPDVCDHPRSKEIFQDVLNERADILEHMNNNMS